VDDRVLDHIKLFHIPLDLSSPSSVIKCATEFLRREEKLDLVLLNAAIAPKERKLTSSEIGGDKVEEALMTNVLGNALLLDFLQKAFKMREEGEQTRIVTVSSELHRRLAFPGKSCLRLGASYNLTCPLD
jgi:NAD(P)-dependent dehydrogenase (short-subunit alcohol dehydrogenase family)